MLELNILKCDFRTYDLRAVRRKVDKLTAELGKAKVKIKGLLEFSKFFILYL